MAHLDQTVMSAQFELCLRYFLPVLAWSLIPAACVLAVSRIRGSFPRRVLWIASITLLAILVGTVFFAMNGLSAGGVGRLIVVLIYLGASLVTLGSTLAAGFMVAFPSHRSLWRLACFGVFSFVTADFLYPLVVAAYCDHASGRRTDGWRWIHCDHVIYLLDPERGMHSQYAGQIEVFPPYFSMPES